MACKSRLDDQRLETCLSCVIFLGLFIYIWQGIEPPLLYSGFGVFTTYPIVSLDPSFLSVTFSAPGGPVSGLAALLAQSYSHASLGSLVIAVILGVLLLGVQRLLRSGQAGEFRDLAWIPPLLALAIYGYYYENPMPVLLAVGLAIWTAILYAAVGLGAVSRRMVWFVAFFAAIYYLAGAAAFVFAGIACLTEALQNRRIVPAVVQAVLAVVTAFVLGGLVFGLAPRAVCTAGTPWEPDKALALSPLANWFALVLHTFVPSLLLVALGGHLLIQAQAGMGTRNGRRKAGRHRAGKLMQARWRGGDPRLWTGLRMLAVAVTAVLCLTFSRTHVHYERALHRYAQDRDWDRVLDLAGRMRGRQAFTPAGVFEINRALAHRGHLGSELCAFPQDETRTLLMTFDDLPGRLLHTKSLELYLDLGYVNAAEKNAYELLEHEGPSPYVLEALVRIHLTKGQYESARVAFRVLRRCVGCREYVRRWEPILTDPARAETDPLLQLWRRVRPTRDSTSIRLSAAALRNLLEDVPDHRLAFEYLMACRLLKNERVELIRLLPMLKPLGYTQLPRHYAEALLVESLMTGKPVDAQGWTLDADLQRQFGEIRRVVTESRGNDQAVYETLVPKYGDTYMFYSMFDLCGLK